MNKHIQNTAHCLLKLYNDDKLDQAVKESICDQIGYLVFSLEAAIKHKSSKAEFKEILMLLISQQEDERTVITDGSIHT